MKKYLNIIILLVIICLMILGCATKQEENIIDNENTIDYEKEEPTFANTDELMLALSEAVEGNQPNNVGTNIETIYEPTADFEGMELTRLELTDHYVFYYYRPIGESGPFNYNTGIVVTYLREGIVAPYTALDAIAEQHNLEYTEDGYLYYQKHNKIYFPVGETRMSIMVPDEMNDYNVLKEFCQARQVTLDNSLVTE